MIKKTVIKAITLFFVCILGCVSNHDKEELINVIFSSYLKMELPYDHKIIFYNNTSSFGDNVETITLQLPPTIIDSILANKTVSFLETNNNIYYSNLNLNENEIVSFILNPKLSTLKTTIFLN